MTRSTTEQKQGQTATTNSITHQPPNANNNDTTTRPIATNQLKTRNTRAGRVRLADARGDAAVERGAPPRERADAGVGVAPQGLALELPLRQQGLAPVLANHGRCREDPVDGESCAVRRACHRPGT